MHDNLIYALVSTIDENTDFKCGEVNNETFQEFEKLDLDLGIKRLFQWHWFLEDIELGPTIYSALKVLESEKKNNYLKNGIIEIGFCPNGDEIFLRTNDSAVLYWSHDEAENGDWYIKEERTLYLTYTKIEYLLVSICNRNFIPWDSYSAREYFELFLGK